MEAKYLIVIFCLSLVTSSRGSLLEMSQTLWTKLLEGGLAKIGPLDPLKVPVVKVDQSEGNTSYRIILRNVEILGLNDSTLESVHIERGRLKSNISDLEAGYVSYTDLRDLESVRYRFHTLVKEPKVQNETFEATVSAGRQEEGSTFRPSVERYQEGRFERVRQYNPDFSRSQDQFSRQDYRGQYDPRFARIQAQPNQQDYRGQYDAGFARSQEQISQQEYRGQYNAPYPRQQEQDSQRYYSGQYDPRFARIQDQPSQQEYRGQYSAPYSRSENQPSQQNYRGQYNPSYSRIQEQSNQQYYRPSDQRYDQRPAASNSHGVVAEPSTTASSKDSQDPMRSDTYDDNIRNIPLHIVYAHSMTTSEKTTQVTTESVDVPDCSAKKPSESHKAQNSEDTQASASENRETRVKSDGQKDSAARLESQPGFIDIVYADDKDNKKMKHFGNLRMEASENPRVYSFSDIMKDIRESRDFVRYNFTEGENLEKRNEQIRAAIESKKGMNMTRYAKNFQETQGFFEQGMQLIYHYGGMGPRVKPPNSQQLSNEGKRTKRAHAEATKTEDDVMHVILRIRVPLLRIKSQYTLTGKVGQQILRGNGQLVGNFTELIGDFTVELKKVENGLMIVRAARAKLIAKEKKIDLQGMDEKGPVQSVLTHGLMAAEAVAAMLADDLSTKVLNEKTTDAMIYRMYKNLPTN